MTLVEEMEMPDRTAYHEAGHALMAIMLGGWVDHITITPDDDDGPERYGDTAVSWPTSNLTSRQLCERDIQVCLAGPVAEMIYRGEPFHPGFVAEWANDWQQAWQLAGQVSPGSGLADQQKRLRWLEQVTVDLYNQLQRDDVWAALAAIVDNLLAHEWLEGDQVIENRFSLDAAWLTFCRRRLGAHLHSSQLTDQVV